MGERKKERGKGERGTMFLYRENMGHSNCTSVCVCLRSSARVVVWMCSTCLCTSMIQSWMATLAATSWSYFIVIDIQFCKVWSFLFFCHFSLFSSH